MNNREALEYASRHSFRELYEKGKKDAFREALGEVQNDDYDEYIRWLNEQIGDGDNG